MKTVCRSDARAFMVRELLVIAFLFGVLLLLALPIITNGSGSRHLTWLLVNMKRLHSAAQQMTLDSEIANTPPGIRWTCTNGQPLKYTAWTNLLVSGHYLTSEEMTGLLEKTYYTKPTNIITVYAVGDFDPPDTVLLASVNWLGPKATNLAKSPLGPSGFVVFRQDGSGAIFSPRQTTLTNIGSGGKYDFLPLQ